MHISLPTLLLLTSHLSPCSPLHLSPSSPHPLSPSLAHSRHTLYIDQKLQLHQPTHPNIPIPIPLNHNLYHARNVTPISPTTSNISLNHELYSKRNGILSPPPAIPTTSDTTTSGDTATEIDTNKSCISALTALHSSSAAGNPSGIAACYNILSFDNDTGAFEAEVRLYRMAKARGEWVGVDTTGMGVDVGVVFEGATVLRVGSAGAGGDGVGERDVGGKGGEGEVVGRDEEEARDLWRRRNAKVPANIGVIEVVGTVNDNFSLGGLDLDTIRTLLTPTITLSGTTSNNTTLTTTLSTNSTSFLTGLFTLPITATNKPSESSILKTAGFNEEYVLPGTTMEIFPTSLIAVSLWTVLCVAVQVWGVWGRWRGREAYRVRVARWRGREGEGGLWRGCGGRGGRWLG